MNKQSKVSSSPSPQDIAIGAHIRALRKQNNETQAALAEALNISQQSDISKLECGSGVNLDKVIKIAKHYNVPYEYLIDGDGHTYALDVLSKYISFESFQYSNPDIDSNTHTLPIIKIKTALFDTLQKIALANSIKDLPQNLREEWITQISKDFANTPIEFEEDSFSSFIIVNKSILEKDDCQNNNIILKLIEACESSSN